MPITRTRTAALCMAISALIGATMVSCKDDPPQPPPSLETLATSPAPADLSLFINIIELDSGESATLSYAVLTPPADPDSLPATDQDTVTIRFAAGLDRGADQVEIYDSTDKRNRDFSFSLADPGVIRGLREAIPGMRTGEIRRIEIPWRLAYGENGRGQIPPATDLVFAVELLSID